MHQKGAVSTLKDLYIIYEKIKINISLTCNYLQKYRYKYIYSVVDLFSENGFLRAISHLRQGLRFEKR